MSDALSKIAAAARKFPPLIALQRERYRRSFPHYLGMFCGIYGSFGEALAHAPAGRPLGYDSKGPAEMYDDRLTRVFASDYPVLFWLQRLMLRKDLRLVDFGGHVGIAFYAYQRYLAYPEGLSWTVVDVPSVVERGKLLARERSETRLRFSPDAAAAGPHEILLASGSPQYVDDADPLGMLQALRHSPEVILLNRIPVHPKHAFVTLQNIGTAFCAYRIYRRPDVLASVAAHGYEIVDEWENVEHRCLLPFEADHSVARYTGFYLRKLGVPR